MKADLFSQAEPVQNLPKMPTTVVDLVAEYQEKDAGLCAAIEAFKASQQALTMACAVQGTFSGHSINFPSLYERDLRAGLLKSGWRAVYNRLDMNRLASAKDKQLFERTIENPPPLTVENARATFGDYFERPRFHILRGLAEAFVDLDPAYKSHTKVRIGAKGLPKRVIFEGWGDFWNSYAIDKFTNMVNAMATMQGLPHFEWTERQAMSAAFEQGQDAELNGKPVIRMRRNGEREELPTVNRGLTVRQFRNGNVHVFFSPDALLMVNRALAEFYGDVLPDAEEENAPKRASTAVAKDLQFYWTPEAVVRAALDFAEIDEPDQCRRGSPDAPLRVLEPSCGDGRIMEGLRERRAIVDGIEVDPSRAAQCRAKGFGVVTANFLEQRPTPIYDRVVMNPPFYGKHYAKHVRHAFEFLKPGGVLVAILPATARYDHDELKAARGDWRDLPVASFAEAGTNVPTVMLRWYKPTPR